MTSELKPQNSSSSNIDFPKKRGHNLPKIDLDTLKNTHFVFDLAGMQKLKISGKDHKDLLHRLSMNEMRNIREGDWIVNAFPNSKGRILDAVLQVNYDNFTELITSPERAGAVAAWLDRYIFIEDVTIENESEGFSPLLVCGANFDELGIIFPNPNQTITAQFGSISAMVLPIEGILPSGILVLAEADTYDKIRNYLIDGKKCVLGDNELFESIRIAEGVPGFLTELNQELNPYECGLKSFISFTKGCYIGQEVVARLDSYDKIKYEYCGVSFPACEIETPIEIFSEDGAVGKLTSQADDLNGGKIGLALIRRKMFDDQREYYITIKSEKIPIKIRAFKSIFR